MRKWRKMTWAGLALALLALVVLAACGDTDTADTATPLNTDEPASAVTQAADPTPEPEAKAEPKAEPKPEPEPEPVEPEMTSGQKNALAAAQDYLDTLPFSKQGLIEQLSSEHGSGFSRADAEFAAENVGADWKQEAVEAAQSYLDTMPFSEQGLYEQLTSEHGSGFTPAQARYALEKVY